MANPKPVEVKITADATGLTKAVGVAQGSLKGLQTQMTSLEALSAKGFSFGGIAGIGLSATAAAAALVGAVKSAADYGDQLANMSERTGVAVEELSKLQYAAKLSDTSNEALGKGLANLSNLMAAAAVGSKDSAALFEKFHIELRNGDGTVKASNDVLLELADVFSAMPDGVEKTALATELFGKKMGQEMIPLLNLGSAGLKSMGDEAERLGLVLSGEQAKAAADFNDNLDRLGALSKSAAVSIGNQLIPALNAFLNRMQDASKADLSLWQILGVLPKQSTGIKQQLDEALATLEKTIAKRDKLYASPADAAGSGIAADIAAQEKRVAYLKSQNKRIEGDDEATAAKRVLIEKQLQTAITNLEKQRGIASGKISADILKDDKARTDEQIKNAEKLRDALQSAWETSRSEALKAADAAKSLLEKAAGVRQSAADKAQDIRDAGLTPEEKAAKDKARAQEALDQGAYYAAASAVAALDGRSEDFEKYRKQAESFLSRAEKFADKSGDANLIEDVGNKQAGSLEAQAKAKQAEAAALESRAQEQQAKLVKIDADLEALKNKAASIEVKADITQAEGQVAALQNQLAALQDKTITVTVQTVQAGAAAPEVPAYASGGMLRGPGSGTSDSILARVSNGEYIVKAAAVSHYGAGLLSRINNMQIPRFASGGQVGGSRSTSTVNLSLNGSSYQMQASQDVAALLTDAVRREALKKGGRK